MKLVFIILASPAQKTKAVKNRIQKNSAQTPSGFFCQKTNPELQDPEFLRAPDQASLPTSGPCRSTACPLNDWIRAPNNDDDEEEEEEEEEEEVKVAEIQMSVPDSGICAY